ncbi:probable phosphomevalonate kinase [Chrysoperla carnea]|uniref:probable phosphomevalonate kinase n=1 Tax=Chrysoperla carnea TaxID=189513 RepID=UPI001D05F7C9|nr:probable phosphomevalonate kinase [Chrysoperla carnea]
MDLPRIIFLVSGKRKSGKDYTVEKIKESIGVHCEIVRISAPIKTHWANNLGLNLNELLGDGPYKEKYRVDMIKWSDEIRQKDYGYFCKAACKDATKKFIWIVSDTRRKTDLKWFRETYGEKIKTIRVTTSNEIREQRGWIFKTGVDDSISECDLDDVNEWDYVINNTPQNYETDLSKVLTYMKTFVV